CIYKAMLTNWPSPQKSSMDMMTFDELQKTFAEGGKDSGSMDMDEFLKNIWTSEETHAMTQNSDCVKSIGNMQKQGSLIVPGILDKKTVYLQKTVDLHKENGGCEDMDLIKEPNLQPQEEQLTAGEMTLEVFLRKTAAQQNSQVLPNGRLFGDYSNSVFGFINKNRNQGFYQEADHTETKIDVKRQKFLPKQAAINLTSSVSPVNEVPKREKIDNLSYLSPSSYFDSSPPPPSSAYGEGGFIEKKRSAILERVIQRRSKRMIKNRESAARSRARKQEYTSNLEAEVAKLKEINHALQIKQEKIMESLKNMQVPEKLQLGSKRLSLRRTLSGPW
uniref:bZIP transcription factor 23-like n=1 Tax=Erigeron canadensis TaxID=72917 RepID=UPI001CB98D75